MHSESGGGGTSMQKKKKNTIPKEKETHREWY